MPNPTFDLQEITAYRTRTMDFTFDLYDGAGDPLVLAADDNVRFKLWEGTDAETPAIDADAIGSMTIDSVVTVIELGVADTTPAQITVRLHQTDTTLLTVGDYFGEAILIDHSDDDVAKPLFRLPVRVEASPAGSLSVT